MWVWIFNQLTYTADKKKKCILPLNIFFLISVKTTHKECCIKFWLKHFFKSINSLKKPNTCFLLFILVFPNFFENNPPLVNWKTKIWSIIYLYPIFYLENYKKKTLIIIKLKRLPLISDSKIFSIVMDHT